jgi:hypothetical protein
MSGWKVAPGSALNQERKLAVAEWNSLSASGPGSLSISISLFVKPFFYFSGGFYLDLA